MPSASKLRLRHRPGGAAYGIIDPEYARVFTQARLIAHQYGYACLMNGSFTRDLDLLLVPWEERAFDNREQLLKLIALACDLEFRDGKTNVYESKAKFSLRPHGRTSCSLHFKKFGDRRFVDISFFPCVPKLPAAAVPDPTPRRLKKQRLAYVVTAPRSLPQHRHGR